MQKNEETSLNDELEKLTKRFQILNDRFLAIAMDYKDKIDSKFGDDEIFKLRNNVLYGLDSARFHFELLLDFHKYIAQSYSELYKKSPTAVLNGSIETMYMQNKYSKELYSLFDSMIYHICSIFDYLFRLINFLHGKETAKNPKWNLFKTDKNLKSFIFCSEKIVTKLEQIDKLFVYPLITHRSHLIHTEKVMGEFNLSFSLDGGNFNASFKATNLFRMHFPAIEKEFGESEITIKQVSLWLFDKTIKYTTEILFELKDEIEQKKIRSHGMIVSLGPGNRIQPMSTNHWGDKSIC